MARPRPHWPQNVIGRHHKLGALIVVAAVLAATALVGVAWAAGFEKIWQTLVYPHWVWLPVALGGEAAAYIGYTLAYRETVRAEGGAELRTPSAAALVATGFGVFLQGGGFALDREALKRAGLRESDARARVLSLGALEYSVLAPAATIAAVIVLVDDGKVGLGLTLPWIIGLPVGAAIALTALRHRRALAGRTGWRARVGNTLSALDLVLRMLRAPRSCSLAFAGVALYWAGDVFCLWAALHAFFAQPPPLAQLLLGYATGYAITRRALPLGGAGLVEALLPFALGWVGIGLPQALLAVAAYRLINLWLPLIPALAAIPALERLEPQPATR